MADSTTSSADTRTQPRKDLRNILWIIARVVIAVALLFYLARYGIIDERGLSRAFMAWPIALLAIALIVFDTALMAWRLSMLFPVVGLRLPFGNALKLTLLGLFFRTFLPGGSGGDLVKLFYAAKGVSGRRTDIVTLVIFDRVIGLFSLLIMPILIAPFFPASVAALEPIRDMLVILGLLAAGLLAAFVGCLFWADPLDRMARRILKGSRIENVPGRVIQTVGAFRHHKKTLSAALGLSLAANFSLVAVMLLAVLALNPGSVDWRVCLLIPVGFIANSVPLTPGGLGVGEAAFDGLFKMIGLHGGGDALLCWRVWFAIVSLSGLVLYVRGIGRSVHDGDRGTGEDTSERPGLPSAMEPTNK